MLSSQKTFIAVGVLVLLILFGYIFFIKDNTTEVEGVSEVNTEMSSEILVLVDTLKRISIDKSLFTYDLFLGLKDFSVNLYFEQQGRINPFSAIGN